MVANILEALSKIKSKIRRCIDYQSKRRPNELTDKPRGTFLATKTLKKK